MSYQIDSDSSQILKKRLNIYHLIMVDGVAYKKLHGE